MPWPVAVLSIPGVPDSVDSQVSAPSTSADLRRVRDFYESDGVINRFLDPDSFERLVWHTQFTLLDDRSQTIDETSFLLEWSGLPATGRVLDFGCGTGALCFKLAANG